MGLFSTNWYVFVPSRNKVYVIHRGNLEMTDPVGTFTEALRKNDPSEEYELFYDQGELLAHLSAVDAHPEYERVN